jgi:hypothetical protein
LVDENTIKHSASDWNVFHKKLVEI